jgi:hypothetical protein
MINGGNMRIAFLAIALLTTCRAAATRSAYDAAEDAVAQHEFRRARDLYHQAAASERDPERRSLATAHAANIEWRVMHDLGAARRTLANAADTKTLLERARAEGELAHDWTAARAFTQRAINAATKRDDRRHALLSDAEVLVRSVRDARIDGRCVPAEGLASVIPTIRGVIDREGPLLGASRMLLNAAILTNDRATMLDAWRWYYGAAPDVPADRRGLGLALAKSKFFDEASLVLADPCSPAIDDPEMRDVIAYAASLRRVRDIADEHYRQVSLGTADVDAFHASLERESRLLWQRFGTGGEFSQSDLLKILFARFGTIVTGGKTGGIDDLHLGHAVVDTRRTIEQYGRRADIRFVALDGIVSNGYSTWAYDHGGHGDGGWNNEQGIFQVRPMYADDPIGDWRLVSDAEVRAEYERDAARETQRDATRDPLTAPIGMTMRMHMQTNDALLAELKAKGLTGDALRSAFLERARDDLFASSILAHEGRHAIDHKEGITDSAELEFNAKLSEVAFAPSPRRAVISGILVNLDPSSPHGKANRRIFKGLSEWMRAHAGEIARLDASKPLLAQFDKLTDDQMRAAFRSMDALARK